MAQIKALGVVALLIIVLKIIGAVPWPWTDVLLWTGLGAVGWAVVCLVIAAGRDDSWPR